MEKIKISQIWQVAGIFDDCQPRTSNMVAKALELKNNSVSVHLCTITHKWGLFEVVKVDACPITGKKAAFYNTKIWNKKKRG